MGEVETKGRDGATWQDEQGGWNGSYTLCYDSQAEYCVNTVYACRCTVNGGNQTVL